jgi:FAD/FMN-containing dehydrogenase
MSGGATRASGTDTVEGLRRVLSGPLLLPGEAAYDEARSVWNALVDRRPRLIARCRQVSDVVACVNFAREVGLPLSVKGGGHNISGLAVCQDGLMLDMSLMREVRVDPEARLAVAQPGCLLGDLDRATQDHGLATVLGFVSTTGLAGLTLGGGFGYLTRRLGWTSDSLRAVELVTADGHVVRASEQEHADLLWGLRGGGGNLGVATSFEYALHPVGPEIVGGVIAWHLSDAADVLDMYRALTAHAPLDLTCAAVLRRAPRVPWLPEGVHGKPIVALVACHTGPPEEASEALAPVRTFLRPVGHVLQRRSYVSQQALLDATQPAGRRYYWKSEFLPALDPALLAAALEHAGRMPSPHSALLLFPIDGALERLPDEHSAVGHRTARFALNIQAAWEAAPDDQVNIEWARSAWRDLRRFSTGGTYVNFLTEEEGDERIRAAYGQNYERLVEVKTRWDPDNLFRVNKNVAPRPPNAPSVPSR